MENALGEVSVRIDENQAAISLDLLSGNVAQEDALPASGRTDREQMTPQVIEWQSHQIRLPTSGG